nr:LuxR C-terminal-related transcriptional regulator [uncultured Duganella sp.]
MDPHGSLLLALYRGARAMPVTEFPEYALALMKTVVRFEKARTTAVELQGDDAVVRGVHLHNEPAGMLLDWAAIKRQDKVFHNVRDHLGKVFNYHAASLFAGPQTALMRDYAVRYEHRNGVVLMQRDAVTGLHDSLALYRVGEDDHFSAQEQALMQQLAPHIQEALHINALHAEGEAQHGDLAIVQFDGAVQFCGPAFDALARQEWPDWRAQRLPARLMTALGRPGGGRYAGRHLTLSCTVRERWLYLRAHKQHRLSQLSPRELEVARRYASGLSSKEVAQQLELSPATVRSFLQKIYQKLDIGDKAQLATAINDAAPRWPPERR